jgi:hypothetical protein
MSNGLSLYKIEETLQSLLDLRETAELEGDAAAAEEIDKAIQEYCAAEVKKVDSIAGAIHHYEAMQLQAKLESERLAFRAKAFQRIVERVKAHAKVAMEAHGVTKVWTAANTLRIQSNGGIEPLEVYDNIALPDSMKRVTVELPLVQWQAIEQAFEDDPGMTHVRRGSADPDRNAIREALRGRTVCPECKGGEPTGEQERCPRCEARGTVPNTVPGARLLPRGTQLRVL